MVIATVIMGLLAIILVFIGYSGWSLWSFARLPIEVSIMGWKFTLIRIASTFFFPPIAGLIANRFFS